MQGGVGGEGDTSDLKDGLDTFFSKKVPSPKVTPVGSPLLEDSVLGSRHGSISSNTSRSREDIRDPKQVVKVCIISAS